MEVCTNNVAEYEALIIGLEIALEMHIKSLQVFGDSQLIIRQLNGLYEVKNPNLILLHGRAKDLINQFHQIEIVHISRSKYDKADALAKLAASLTLPDERDIQITIGEHHLLTPALERSKPSEEVNVILVYEIEEDLDWRQAIYEYLHHGDLPNDTKNKVDVKR